MRRTTTFCDIITADHRVLIEEGELQNNQRYAIDVQDLATQWIQSYPCKSKTSQKMARILRKFIGPEENPKVTHTCNSLEFGKACEDLHWNHRAFTPNRTVTYGKAEEQKEESKKALRLFYCSLDSTNCGGQILLNVLAGHAMSKISCQMGKLHFHDASFSKYSKNQTN